MWFVVSRSDMCVKDDVSEAVATTDQVATDCFKEHESCGTKYPYLLLAPRTLARPRA